MCLIFFLIFSPTFQETGESNTQGTHFFLSNALTSVLSAQNLLETKKYSVERQN